MSTTRTVRARSPLALFLLFSAIAACEGEPPKVPEGSGAPPTPEPSAEVEQTPPPQTPAPTTVAPCSPCAPPDAGTDGGNEVSAPTAPPPAAPTALVITGAVSSGSKPLAFAVVYLEDAPIEPDAKMTARIDNKAMSFVPFVTVIPAGGKVIFHNSDPFPHNVFSPDSGKFNMGTISHEQAMVHAFKSAGTYSLLCNLHPGMLGYLVVAPSSYFAKADAKGRYTIKAVPPGTYKATAWAPRMTPVTQSVQVKDKDATLDFELHR